MKNQKKPKIQRQPKLVLRFSPYSWAKLNYMRDRGPCEVGGFGVTRADDLLYVEDFVTVDQEVTAASVEFDDIAVADFFDMQIESGRKPEQCGRIWIHTHPGNSPRPSDVDEETFARVFCGCDFSIMFILARGGDYYARLSCSAKTPGWVELPIEIDYSRPFAAGDHKAWAIEYEANVKEVDLKIFSNWKSVPVEEDVDDFLELNCGYTRREIDNLTDDEKQEIADEFREEVFYE